MTQGCFTIIINDKNQILLGKRQDYPLWDLPGGRLEENEELIDCAIRETLEETGYQIIIDDKIGTYHRPKFHDIQHIYIGHIVGGQASLSDETKVLKWFTHLPINMVPNRRKQIKDYKKCKRNIEVTLKDNNILFIIHRFI
ncbi:MAG: NUDIX hydrolase [Erysipelotrichaceae bacterium]|nr:NUDIX hydrolase [Erysipelotrichaceae bacterium]